MNAICAQQHCKSHAISVLWIFSAIRGVYFLIFDLFYDFQPTQRISQSAGWCHTATAIHQICALSLLFGSMVEIGIYTGFFSAGQIEFSSAEMVGKCSFRTDPIYIRIFQAIFGIWKRRRTDGEKKTMSIDNSLEIKKKKVGGGVRKSLENIDIDIRGYS